MKKLFTLFFSFCTFSAIYGQYATPTINGTIAANEYGTHSAGSNQGTNFFMTWDATNLYVAVQSSSTGEAAVIYIDKDPLPTVDGGTNSNGSTAGNNYDGENFAKMPFRADFVCYVKSGYREYRNANGSNGWGAQTSGFGSFAESGGNVREFSIPWSAITGGSIPSSFNWFGLVTSSGGFVYNQEPVNNPSGGIGTSANYAYYHTVSTTADGSPTKPFSLLSYTTFGTATISTNVNLYDFTTNTSASTISVSNGITLTSTGKMTFADGKISLGTGNVIANTVSGGSATSYVATTGTGTLTINNVPASATLFSVGTASTYAPATVNNAASTRNFSVKVGTTLSGTPAVAAKMVQLEWNVTPSVSMGNNAALTFQWPVGSEGGSFVRGNTIEIAHYNGTIWDSYKLATLGGAGPYTATASGFTTFSPFVVANQNALSAELLNITAQSKGTNNLITWQTASEKDNALFQIERASNATDFSPIGEVKGSGSSAAAKNYTFTDATPLSGVNYYRLKAVDYNGAATLSKVVSVNFSGKIDGKIAVYPNPTRDVLRVDVNAADASTTLVQITDLMGRVVLSQSVTVNKGANLLPLNVATLPSGAYFVKVNGDVTRFVKQ